MKIIYCSNPQGSLSKIYTLLKETIADMYIISGNLLDTPFYSHDLAHEYEMLQNTLLSRRSSDDPQPLTAFAASLSANKATPATLKNESEQYLTLTARATESIKKKYTMLEKILSTKPYARIFILPGHDDINPAETDVQERSIHYTAISAAPFTIAGLGGDSFHSPSFPESLCLYNDTSKYEEAVHAFLSETHPDIIFSHLPPSGVFKNSPRSSESLKLYCRDNDVLLCVSGYAHDDWGLITENDTTFIHAPSFGSDINGGEHHGDGGFFYEIDMPDDRISRCKLQKLVKDRVYDIASYSISGNTVTESIIDNNRYNALKNGQPFDIRTEKYEHIPEIRRFKDIRNFFKIYQTEHTEKKISQLVSALEKMGDEFSDVALDLVGSANLGLAQKSSDLDMVLYIRSPEAACFDEETVCDRFGHAEERIREILKDAVEFEIIDTINLDLVEESIRELDYTSSSLQRFIVYRSMCRPVNYRVIAPAEDLLNSNMSLRREIEETMSEYLQVFGTTKDTTKSFDKYRMRIQTLGVDIPEVLEKKIRNFLQKD
ncbi:MAG TPA: nucleotidyltransferase domain-containing protein [Spirochaetota bacterium]|nr:nucleotidyltransferase domain-containing protein [Spirochaetota bacterium]HQP47480.1 nucleotidyltransferase domain-containing protein [Spirochaetota bacterium]